MDAAVESRLVEVGASPPLPEESLRMAFFLQSLILALAQFVCWWIYSYIIFPIFNPNRIMSSPSWKEIFFVCVMSLATLGVVWLIVFVVKSIAPDVIRRLTPRALDKYLVPAQDTEVESILSQRAKLTPNNVMVAERLTVMLEIRDRVRRLRLRTTGILTTMGMALAGAAIIVVFAGSLTSIDATAVSNVDKVKSDLTEEQRQLTRLYQMQSLLSQLEEAKKVINNKPEIEKLERQIFGGTSTSGSLPTDVPGVQQMIDHGKERIGKLDKLLETAWTKELDSQHGYSDWKYITATAITRVGVVLIIIYLVQILMGLYRYNMRLATYYNAKRDVLTLWDCTPASLKRLDEIIGPPKFDFGKEPKHPLEDLLKAAGSKIGSSVSRAKKVEEQVS
jgi:hypothetical protein